MKLSNLRQFCLGATCGSLMLMGQGAWADSDCIKPKISSINYDEIECLVEGLAAFRDKNQKYGFLNEVGKVVILPKYDQVGNFSDGLAIVFDAQKQKVGFIDKTGKLVIPFQYDPVGDEFYKGVVAVAKNDKVGLIDKKGNIIIDFQYDDFGFFDGSLLVAKKGGKYGVLDREEKTIIDFEYDFIGNFDDGLAIVEKEGKYGVVSDRGQVIVVPQYSRVDEFKDGVAFVDIKDDNGHKMGYIDRTGKIILPLDHYVFVKEFVDGKAKVRLGNDIYYIDKKGNRLSD